MFDYALNFHISFLQVYLSLLKMYLKPQELPSLGIENSIFSGYEMEPNVKAAISVMNEHYHKIDVAQVQSYSFEVVCFIFISFSFQIF